VYTVLEHEQMHHETLMYIVSRLDPAHKTTVLQAHVDTAPPVNRMQTIAAGAATLGADPDEIASMIVYASSVAASATTGASLRVDGGVVRSIA